MIQWFSLLLPSVTRINTGQRHNNISYNFALKLRDIRTRGNIVAALVLPAKNISFSEAYATQVKVVEFIDVLPVT